METEAVEADEAAAIKTESVEADEAVAIETESVEANEAVAIETESVEADVAAAMETESVKADEAEAIEAESAEADEAAAIETESAEADATPADEIIEESADDANSPDNIKSPDAMSSPTDADIMAELLGSEPDTDLPPGLPADLAEIFMDEAPEKPVEPPPNPLDVIDLDSQIEQLLRADMAASESFEVRDIDGLVQDKAIYDEENENMQWAAYGKLPGIKTAKLLSAGGPRGLAAMPAYQLAILAVLLIAAIMGIGFTAVMTARTIISRAADQARIAHYTPIVQPVNVSNTANVIYINETVELSGRRLTLSRMSAGSKGTIFYFNQVLDPERYAIILYDQNNTLYPRSFFDMYGATPGGTAAKFAGLNNDAVFLRLHIRDLFTGEAATFFYRFEQFPTFVNPVYFIDPVPVFESGGMELLIHHAEFDNSCSKIFYSFNSEGAAGEIRFGDYSERPFIQVTESIHILPAMTVNPAEARFDQFDMVLGMLNFAPVRNLHSSSLEITFNDLYYRYTLPRPYIDLQALFARRPEEQKIRVGGRQLVLEGMAMQGDFIVLVLHGEDTDGHRLETRVDATLTAETNDGLVILNGIGRASSIGSDVVFNIAPYRAQLSGVPLTQYNLNIYAVEYRIPRFTANLNLSNTRPNPERFVQSAERVIRESFLSRLAYKSNEINRNRIMGFSDELINDRSLMRLYAPVASDANPMYGVIISGGVLTEDLTYMAVVEEEWAAGEGAEMIHFRHTHQIIAERKGSGWEIVSDIIIH
jgi:hypothetical protein